MRLCVSVLLLLQAAPAAAAPPDPAVPLPSAGGGGGGSRPGAVLLRGACTALHLSASWMNVGMCICTQRTHLPTPSHVIPCHCRLRHQQPPRQHTANTALAVRGIHITDVGIGMGCPCADKPGKSRTMYTQAMQSSTERRISM